MMLPLHLQGPDLVWMIGFSAWQIVPTAARTVTAAHAMKVWIPDFVIDISWQF
ncbi:MAG: hypothetical protein WAO20_21110 [Acidobacteriota bacterium]